MNIDQKERELRDTPFSSLTPRHPGLSAILKKLNRRESLTSEEIRRLQRQLQELREPADPEGDKSPTSMPAFVPPVTTLLAGHATRAAGEQFAAQFGKQTVCFYRPAQDLLISSIGIGTYRGATDPETDAAYISTIFEALQGGINLIDTSLNYRHQRSERNVGVALQQFVQANGNRDEVVICTKGGFLSPDGFAVGSLDPADVVGNLHCIAPDFLADQIERSCRNLGLQTIDVYYIHNPEIQLQFISMPVFLDRIRAAFERLERAVDDNLIRSYGTATWQGYYGGGLSLPSLLQIAQDIAGDQHHFRFIQLPFNLGVRESLSATTSNLRNTLQLAADSGITVVASASLMQGRLSRDLPEEIKENMTGLTTDAQRALQFTRSTPGITCALVGMRCLPHLAETFGVAKVPPLTRKQYRHLSQFMWG